uniref:(California timema) hypothetical protein n=1 Tax=Timema californicum TaxID=61474 RepID=A0A7R9JKD6_TIMCA|nr:unnamed protein product [Timema californicum]
MKMVTWSMTLFSPRGPQTSPKESCIAVTPPPQAPRPR